MMRRAVQSLSRRGFHTSTVLKADAAAGAAPTKINLNFQLPHESVYRDTPIDMLVLPGAAGEYGVTAGHVPILSQLKPGVIQIHHVRDKEVEKYFVAGGFAFTHQNSNTDITALEAVKLEDIDPEAARSGAAKYKAALDAAAVGSPERVNAQIGYDVHQALISALGLAA